MQSHLACIITTISSGYELVCAAVQEFGVVSYTLLLALIEYKTLVMRGDMEAAEELLPSIPQVLSPHCCPKTLRSESAC